MSQHVCKRHRRAGCADCRSTSRTSYGEDYASNLFVWTSERWPTAVYDDGGSSHSSSGHHSSHHHDSGSSYDSGHHSSGSSHDSGGSSCGSGGGGD